MIKVSTNLFFVFNESKILDNLIKSRTKRNSIQLY